MTRDSELLAYIESVLTTPRPDCLIWPHAVDRGYGRITVDNKSKRVHRVVWELKHGPIPEGLTIDHLCRIRPCCNTEHMELVTQEENNRRKPQLAPRPDAAKAPRAPRAPITRSVGTHCLNGHEYTPENTFINARGWRRCRTCNRARQRALRARATSN